MKKNTVRIISTLLCAILVCFSLTGASLAEKGTQTAEAPENTAETTSVDANSAAEKDETVYVIAGADGSVQKLIVSDWLKNTDGSDTIIDVSELTDIENVKGDESFAANGSSIVWDAGGGDIYYQGNTEKELPVTMKISYTLDGKYISAADIAGKSGKVGIRFDYTNTMSKMVEIDGKQEKIYVPFAMLTGILLDNGVFTNVEVSNGKLISDGDRTAVVGFAFPGMNENLGIDTDTLDIPSYFEITANAENFSLNSTVSIATNSVFNGIDAEKLDRTDELTDKLGELTDAMGKLMDGSSDLYDGICTLLDKSGELVSGINSLAQGAQALKTGSSALSDGAYELSQGAAQLSDGLTELTANNDKLNAGSKAVFDTLLKTAGNQLAAAGVTGIPELTIENYKSVLNGVASSLSEENIRAQAEQKARESVTAAVNEKRADVEAAVTAAVRAQVKIEATAGVRDNIKTMILAAQGMTPESYQQAVDAGIITVEQQGAIESAADAQMQTEAAGQAVEQNTDAAMSTEKVQALITAQTNAKISALIEENMNSAEVRAKIEAGVSDAKSGAAEIKALIGELDAYNEFYLGVADYTAGAAKAAGGASQLKSGTQKLYGGSRDLDSGIKALLDGVITMKNGAPALTSGIEQLKDGSMQLRDGLAEFNEKGVAKLTQAFDGDISGLISRIKATAEVSKEYTSFSGIADDTSGTVKFIYRTESIGE